MNSLIIYFLNKIKNEIFLDFIYKCICLIIIYLMYWEKFFSDEYMYIIFNKRNIVVN